MTSEVNHQDPRWVPALEVAGIQNTEQGTFYLHEIPRAACQQPAGYGHSCLTAACSARGEICRLIAQPRALF